MIVVADYGVGNVGSIASMLRKGGVTATVSGDPNDIEAASKIILPGVGAFDHCMRCLRERGLIEPLTRRVMMEGVPFLGICVGMQMLAHRSAEGDEAGLGWLDAEVVRFDPAAAGGALTVPHMGWNTVIPGMAAEPDDWGVSGQRFYFVHSFHLQCARPEDVWGWTTYGYEFASAIRVRNVLGVQFHPEKSHRFGLDLLKRFATQV